MDDLMRNPQSNCPLNYSHQCDAACKQQYQQLKYDINLPPILQRFVVAQSNGRVNSSITAQLKTFIRLCDEDLENVILYGNSLALRSSQSSSRTFAKYNFDHIFTPDVTQQQVCSTCLPDLLQAYFNGSDACLVYFGTASTEKERLLYSESNGPQPSGSNYPGIFQSTLLLIFRLLAEFRIHRREFRHSIRISALYYSHRGNKLTDLISPFFGVTNSEVEISEDTALGIKLENHYEVRIDTVENALYYLREILKFRLAGKKEEQRCGHLFFYVNLYRYKTNTSKLIGGRSRLCLIDLGLGEKNSKGDVQALTMPVITNLLVALFQGQRHIPSRQSPLCMLLKEALGHLQSKPTVLCTTLSFSTSENENIVQMMTKIQRAAKSKKTFRVGSDSSSASSTRRRVITDSETNSSSEQSCAETVIFLGPSVKVDSLQSRKEKSKALLDPDRQQRILNWIDCSMRSPKKDIFKVNAQIQCSEEEIDCEMAHLMNQYAFQRELHDIYEEDEEFVSSSPKEVERIRNSMSDGPFTNTISGHLSILSLERTSNSTKSSENGISDDDLEKAMAASISSIRSHEILSKCLEEQCPKIASDSGESLDLCRETKNLEKCTHEKPHEIVEMDRRRRKNSTNLVSCDNSLAPKENSTTLKFFENETAKRENCSAAGATWNDNNFLSFIPVKSSNKVNKIDAAYKAKMNKYINDSLIASNFSSQIRLCEATDPNMIVQLSTSRDGSDMKKEKKGKKPYERRNSTETGRIREKIPSPYHSKNADTQLDSGTYSSGHGSDENGSIYFQPQLRLFSMPPTSRNRNRESLSASSGYESASGESKNSKNIITRRLFWETKSTKLIEEEGEMIEQRIRSMVARQKQLREELKESKKLLCVIEEPFITAFTSSLEGRTLLEALTQETKILEKRLIACRNHAMIVTCFP